MKDPMIIILLIAAVISAVTTKVIHKKITHPALFLATTADGFE